MFKWEFLAILTLHDGLVLVERVEREVVQVAERVEHQAGLPFDGEVGHVLDRVVVLLPKDVRL